MAAASAAAAFRRRRSASSVSRASFLCASCSRSSRSLRCLAAARSASCDYTSHDIIFTAHHDNAALRAASAMIQCSEGALTRLLLLLASYIVPLCWRSFTNVTPS